MKASPSSDSSGNHVAYTQYIFRLFPPSLRCLFCFYLKETLLIVCIMDAR